MISMVRITVEQVFDENKKYIEAYCNSGDSKPGGNIITGSFCYEVDTGKTFLYDEKTSEWIDQDFSSGGGE